MLIRTSILALAALIAAVAGPRPAHACSCAPTSIADSYRESEGVFVARVDRLIRRSDFGEHLAQVQILHSWRGLGVGRAELLSGSSSSDCGYVFEAGRTYLVFAYRSDGHYAASVCRETRPVADVDEAIALVSNSLPGTARVSVGFSSGDISATRATPEAVEAQASTDLSTVLWPIPGVYPIRRSWATTGLSIRGLTGRRVLVLQDGFRVNSALLGDDVDGLLTLTSPRALAGVDVERGPSAARWGPSALGGVIRLHRREPYRGHVPVMAQLFTRVDSAGPAIDGGLREELRLERIALSAALRFNYMGDRAGGPPLDEELQTSFLGLGGDFQLRYTSDFGELSGTFSLHSLSNAGLVETEDAIVESEFERHRRHLVWLGWRHGGFGRHFSRADVRVGFLGQAKSQHEDLRRGGDELIRTAALLASFTTPLADTLSADWEARLHGEFLEVDGGATPNAQAPAVDGSRYLTSEAGVTLAWTPLERLRVLLDGQAEWVIADVPATAETDAIAYDWLTGSGALITAVQASGALEIRAVVGSAVGHPSLRDLYGERRTEGGTTVPNSELVAERALGGELGLRLRLPPFGFELSGHVTRLYDAISLLPTGLVDPGNLDDFGVPRPILQTDNGDGARLYGLDWISGVQVGDLELYGTLAWLETEDLSTAAPVRLAPPRFNGQIGMRFEREDWGAGAYTRYASAVDAPAAGETPSEGYAVFGLDGFYQWAFWGRATLMIDNLGNRGYRTHGSSVPEPGFHVVAALSLQFP